MCSNIIKSAQVCDKYWLQGQRAHYQRRHYQRTGSNIIKFAQVCEKYMRHLQSAHYCQTAGSSRENLLVGQWEKEPVWFWPTIPLAVLTFCDHRHHLYLLSWVILHLHKISSCMEQLPMFAKARNICANVLQYHQFCTSMWQILASRAERLLPPDCRFYQRESFGQAVRERTSLVLAYHTSSCTGLLWPQTSN